MSDPLSDPRAADLLSADPGEVWVLAGTFGRVASEAQTVAAGLRGAQNDATWTGPAATAFRSKLGKLPGDLDKVEKSYREVADALNTYEGELATIKPAFQHLAAQLGTARSGLAGAQGSLSTAENHLTTVAGASHPAAQTVHDAQSAVNLANGTVTRLQGEVNGLETQGMQLLDRFDTARRSCQQHVSSACSIPPHQSWLDAALHDIGNFMSGAGHFLAGVAKGVWDGVTGLPGALVDFVEHPSWKSFEKLAEDVAITAGVVLLATGVGELAFAGDAAAAAAAEGAGEGAAGALSAANGVAGTVAKSAVLASAGGEGVQAGQDALEGKGREALSHLAAGGLDALVALSPELGDALPSSVRAEAAEQMVSTVKGYASAVKGYASAVEGGASPLGSALRLGPEGFDVVMTQALDVSRRSGMSILQVLANPAKLVESSEASAKLLHIASLPGKMAVNFGADKLLIDPLKEADKAQINHRLGVCEAG